MKPTLTLILAILTVATIMGTVAADIQQVSAPRTCGGCTAFKKLTHEFEKEVINAAKAGDLNLIPGLLEQYQQDVRVRLLSTLIFFYTATIF
jgi:hypothetical protein